MSGPKPVFDRQKGGWICPKCETTLPNPAAQHDCKPPLLRKGGMHPLPALKLRQFNQNSELTAVEQDLGLRGLCQKLIGVALQQHCSKTEAASLLRFIAHSRYFEKQKSVISSQVKRIHAENPNKNERLERLRQFADEQLPPPRPYESVDVEKLATNSAASEKFFSAGMDALRRIRDSNGCAVEPTAEALVSHALNMGAKGYGRWVYTLTKPKQQVVKVGSEKTIFWAKVADAFDGNHVQFKWVAYKSDEDGDNSWVEPDTPDGAPKVGAKYHFFPPPSWAQRGVEGLVKKIDEGGKVTVTVLKVLPEVEA